MKRIVFLLTLSLVSHWMWGQNNGYLTQEEMLQEYFDLLRKDSLSRANDARKVVGDVAPLTYDITPCETTDSTPPYSFYMKKGYGMNTLNGKVRFFEADHATMTVYSEVPCCVYMFYPNEMNLFGVHTYSFYHFYPSSDNSLSMYTVSLDDLLYDLSPLWFVVVSQNGQSGYAYLRIQGDKVSGEDGYDSLCVSGEVTPALQTFPQDFDGTMLFTAHSDSLTDPKILFFEDGEPTFCDDYKGKSLFDWGKEAKIVAKNDSSQKQFIIFSDGYRMNTDLFICKEVPTKESLFPLYKDHEEDFCLSAPKSDAYNCFSWAMRFWDKIFMINTSTRYYWEDGVRHFYLDNYLGCYGLTPEGATMDNSDVDIWVCGDDFTHASIRCGSNGYSNGYAWESKIGYDERIMHPRYALTCDDTLKVQFPYGHVDHYLIYKNHYVAPKLIPTTFTAEEKAIFTSEIQKADVKLRNAFLMSYKNLKDSIEKYCIQNYKLIPLVSLNLC